MKIWVQCTDEGAEDRPYIELYKHADVQLALDVEEIQSMEGASKIKQMAAMVRCAFRRVGGNWDLYPNKERIEDAKHGWDTEPTEILQLKRGCAWFALLQPDLEELVLAVSKLVEFGAEDKKKQTPSSKS